VTADLKMSYVAVVERIRDMLVETVKTESDVPGFDADAASKKNRTDIMNEMFNTDEKKNPEHWLPEFMRDSISS
jgi:hypothetical protein